VREERFLAEREATVGPEEGIHGRPAAQFIKAAKRFSSRIVVIKGDREVNAKSVMKMTGLAKKGERIIIRAEGDDAEEAVDTLAELIAKDEH
jgi:phosphotransferase system HPr (HPr) family protein